MAKQEMVRLVSTEICTPYRAGEVATFPKNVAEQLLHRNMEKTDFGPRYEKVKWRPFIDGQDDELLLYSRSLNQPDHNALLRELHPEKLDKDGEEIVPETYNPNIEDDEDEGPTTEVEAAARRGRRRG